MIILASQSPRRHQLLKLVADDFVIEASDITEDLDNTVIINKAIEELAYKKAFKVFKKHPEDIVVGADTIVLLKEEVLGKPKDREDAIAMLMKLSDNIHYVLTGVSILSKQASSSFNVVTQVVFYKLSEKHIVDYVDEYKPFDKAGAYAIQDKAATFIKEIHGDYYNIMGLPVARLSRELARIKELIK